MSYGRTLEDINVFMIVWCLTRVCSASRNVLLMRFNGCYAVFLKSTKYSKAPAELTTYVVKDFEK